MMSISGKWTVLKLDVYMQLCLGQECAVYIWQTSLNPMEISIYPMLFGKQKWVDCHCYIELTYENKYMQLC